MTEWKGGGAEVSYASTRNGSVAMHELVLFYHVIIFVQLSFSEKIPHFFRPVRFLSSSKAPKVRKIQIWFHLARVIDDGFGAIVMI